MLFALLFIAIVLLVPFVLWVWVYVSAFQVGWKLRRERKSAKEMELAELAGELDEARSRLLAHPRADG